MRWTPRRMALIASIALAVAGVDLVITVPAVAADFETRLSYTCAAGKGRTHKVAVRFSGSMPRTGVAGKAIQPGAITVKAKVPVALAGQVLGPQLRRITGTVRAAVKVGQAGRRFIDAQWPELAVASAAIPDSGRVELKASGAVPAVIPAASGDVVFTAGSLTLKVKPDRGTGPGAVSPSTGGATISCVPERAARVAVVKIPNSLPVSAPPPGTAAGTVADGPRCIPVEGDLNPKIDLEKPYDQGGGFPPGNYPAINTREQFSTCGQFVGSGNLKKLGGSAPAVGRVRVQRNRSGTVSPRSPIPPNGNWTLERAYAVSEPTPATATLLGFGFMPTTATTVIKQVGTANVEAFLMNSGIAGTTPTTLRNPSGYAYGKAFISVGVEDVRVNGTPVNVGSSCATEGETFLRLLGNAKSDAGAKRNNILTTGGDYSTPVDSHVDSRLTIPRFVGCGEGEDLSPLLTATAAGGGNVVQFTQGPLCGPEEILNNCREAPHRWTVQPGGKPDAAADGPLIIKNETPGKGEIRCNNPKISVELTPRKDEFVRTLGTISFSSSLLWKTEPLRCLWTGASGGKDPLGRAQLTLSLGMEANSSSPENGTVQAISVDDRAFTAPFAVKVVPVPPPTDFNLTLCNIKVPAARFHTEFNNNTQTFTIRRSDSPELVVQGTGRSCEGLFDDGDRLSLTIPPIRLTDPKQRQEIIGRPA